MEDQCLMIAEFFVELDEEMNAMYNSKSWRRQDALMSFAGTLQEEFLIGSNTESNSNELADDLPVTAPELITPKSDTNFSVSSKLPDEVAKTSNDNLEESSPDCILVSVLESSAPDHTDVLSEEGSILENFPKFKEDKATATTTGESWDESGILASDLDLMIDPQPIGRTIDTVPNIEVQETRKERDRRLLRQHCATYRGPKERKKIFRHSRHQNCLDSIHENDGEEGRNQASSTIPKDLKIAPVADSELEEVVINVRRLKSMQITRERMRRRFWYRSQNKRRTKTSSNSSVCNNCWLQMVKWWAMTMIIGTYSCAANRYAKMWSNKRFKAGD